MIVRALLPLALAFEAVAVPATAPKQRTFILSVEGIKLGPKEYVDRFSIDTWGIHVLASCKIPPGWTITAGSSADPTGTIAGEASLGVTFLDRTRVKQLRDMILIAMDEPLRKHAGRKGELPATFAGTADIGVYGGGEQARTQKLDYRNIRLVRATRCPRPEVW